MSSSPLRLGFHLWPDSGSCHEMYFWETYASSSSYIGHWRKMIHITVLSEDMLPAQCKLQPIWIYILRQFWHVVRCFWDVWNVAVVFGLVGTLMWPQAIQNWSNSCLSLYLLNIAKVGQQDLQVAGEKYVCMSVLICAGRWHEHVSYIS